MAFSGHPDYVSGGSTGGQSAVAFNGAQVVKYGCNCYHMKGTQYTFVTHPEYMSIDVVDEGDFGWLIHFCSLGNATPQRQYIQRKNIDTSFCSNNSRTCVFGEGFIRNGTSSSYVFNLQFILRYWYSEVPITGTVDAATLEAIKKFQKAVGLSSDGIVGDDTKDALIYYRRRALPR